MLRLTRTHRVKISNRMAIFAAFLLVAATMAGVNSSFNDTMAEGKNIVNTASEAPAQAKTVRSVKAKKGLKANFFLFRHK